MLELPQADYRALLDQLTGELAARLAADGAPALPARAGGGGALAPALEHTCLRAEAGAPDIARLCEEARRFGFGAVCVAPVWLRPAVAALRDTNIRVVSVVGFPLGASGAAVKRFEAAECLKLGADELDLVIDIGAAREGRWTAVCDEVREVAALAHAAGAALKAILETGLLDANTTLEAARHCAEAGADFIKNGTGHGPRGATVDEIQRLRAALPARVGIKAAGGIRTREQALALLAAGAARLGSSHSVEIVG